MAGGVISTCGHLESKLFCCDSSIIAPASGITPAAACKRGCFPGVADPLSFANTPDIFAYGKTRLLLVRLGA